MILARFTLPLPLLTLLLAGTPAAFAQAAGWEAEPAILARIAVPAFPPRDFPIDRYGAKGDGRSDCTAAITQAIADCHEAGGGRVVVPPGLWATGPIELLAGVDLEVSSGATLRFDPNPERYLPLVATRFNGMDLMNYRALISAHGQRNIAITGQGTLDGSGSYETWWSWTRNKVKGTKFKKSAAAVQRLSEMVDKGTPLAQRIFGPGSFLRPNFVDLVNCRGVLIEGVHVRNSPMWEFHPLFCTDVVVRGVDILSHGPNNDGCDPESCRDVLIDRCVFDTGDDCIAIKSGRNDDGRRAGVPAEDIIVQNCRMKGGHGGVTLGSECSGGIRDIFVQDCIMDGSGLNCAFRIKSNAMRGGVIEDAFVRRLQIGRVGEEVVQVDFRYDEGARGPYRPVVRNIYLDHVVCSSSPCVLSLLGLPNAPVGPIHLTDCTFRGIEDDDTLEYAARPILKDVTIERAGAAAKPLAAFPGVEGAGAFAAGNSTAVAAIPSCKIPPL